MNASSTLKKPVSILPHYIRALLVQTLFSNMKKICLHKIKERQKQTFKSPEVRENTLNVKSGCFSVHVNQIFFRDFCGANDKERKKDCEPNVTSST